MGPRNPIPTKRKQHMATDLIGESQESFDSFDIVLKVTERCNLACPYCYYFYQEYDGNAKNPLMSEEVMEELPEFLLRSSRDLKIDQFNISLHGGEPLLMKSEKVDHLLTSLREKLTGKVKVSFSCQTNGVLIDEEWIDLFSKHDVQVGVSIDGPKEIHDRGRPDHQGRGSYDDAIRGLRLLQQAKRDGKMAQSPGALSVWHSAVDGPLFLRHFINELEVASPCFNYPRGGRDSLEAINWNLAVEKHRELINYWLDNFVFPDFHYIRGVSDPLVAIQSDKGAAYNDRLHVTRHHVATISSEGDLNIDDNVMGTSERLGSTGLKIFGTSLKDLVLSPLFQELTNALDSHPAECHECEWFRSCRSGNLFDRFSRRNGFLGKSVFCGSIKMMHEELADFLVSRGVISIEDLAARLSAKPTVSAKERNSILLRCENSSQAPCDDVLTA